MECTEDAPSALFIRHILDKIIVEYDESAVHLQTTQMLSYCNRNKDTF